MKVRIGQVFRVPSSGERQRDERGTAYQSYIDLTRGKHGLGADVQKGIFSYRQVKERDSGYQRIPAILLHSNPFKEGSADSPWMDIVEPDLGYAFYNGDNHDSKQRPWDARGNALIGTVLPLYSGPAQRKSAPPLLLFRQVEIAGNRKGYREFCGYGVPTRSFLVTQREKDSTGYFTNLAMELALFRLDEEDESFDWNWIDLRRDGSRTCDEVLQVAPSAWRMWVKKGDTAIEKCRRHVAGLRIIPVREQLELSDPEMAVLSEIKRFYAGKPHAFEGLAARVTECVIGGGCKRAWVTQRSGDGGVDFVCRLDLGSQSNKIPLVVLGQAKLQNRVSGKDIARLVARLQRGWVGVFVTSGAFSVSCQEEIQQDNYPVVLINGKRLAREIHVLSTTEGVSVSEILRREWAWYAGNLRPLPPSRVVDQTTFGTQVGP